MNPSRCIEITSTHSFVEHSQPAIQFPRNPFSTSPAVDKSYNRRRAFLLRNASASYHTVERVTIVLQREEQKEIYNRTNELKADYLKINSEGRAEDRCVPSNAFGVASALGKLA